MNKIKVLILCDEQLALIYKKLFIKLNLKLHFLEAPNVIEARKRVVDDRPNVILMNDKFDNSKALYFLNKLKHHFPIPVVILSDSLNKEKKKLFICNGAIEAICINNLSHHMEQEVYILKKVFKNIQNRLLSSKNSEIQNAKYDIIGIGSSTGGTEALASIFKNLPINLPPILIAQHMPPEFTRSFADRLDSLGPINVKEAVHGDPLERGWAYVAPGKTHMAIKSINNLKIINIFQDLGDHKYSPSVDVLFYSISKTFGSKSLAFLLTGMGKDGALGLKAIRDKGGHTICQDEASSAIYGMPKEAKSLDACDRELSLAEIPRYIKYNLGGVNPE